jgi:predicted HTH transcriptional regulator
MKARFKQMELERMYRLHALPPNWEHLDYRDFLEKRRELMAQVIAEGYSTLVAERIGEDLEEAEIDLSKLVLNGESEAVEFKSTLRTNLHTGDKDARMELAVLKTLSGFLNTNGGMLVIGLSDDGTPVGIQADDFTNEDKMSLHLVNIVKSRMGVQAMTSLHAHFDDHDDCRVMVIKCRKSPTPIFLKDGNTERFFIRTGPSTTELSASQTQEYIKQRFMG